MSIDALALRSAFGRFATGVCVVTVPDINNSGQYLAMTINSFSSVSLEPALLLWSLQNSSEVFDSFSQAKYFSVSILSSAQQEISNLYAKKGDHLLQAVNAESVDNRFQVVAESLASFNCELDRLFEAGDHHLILGKILSFKTIDSTGAQIEPLAFYQGKYSMVTPSL